MRVLQALWADEAGFVVSSELVLIATLLVIGLVVGLTSLRNQVVQELTDMGAAIGNVSQGYQLYGTRKTVTVNFIATTIAQTDASAYDDQLDFCQTSDGADPAGAEPGGISVREAPGASNVPGE